LSTRVYEIASSEDKYDIQISKTRVPYVQLRGVPLEQYTGGDGNEGAGDGFNAQDIGVTQLDEHGNVEGVDSYDGVSSSGDGSASEASSSKVICTAMLNMYGFGGFRRNVWMKYNKSGHMWNHRIHELGYHRVMGPLSEMMPHNKLLNKALSRFARVRTAALKRKMQGKSTSLERKLHIALLCVPLSIAGFLVDRGILKPYKIKRK